MEKWKDLIRTYLKAFETGKNKESRDSLILAETELREHFARDIYMEGEEMGLSIEDCDRWIELDKQEYALKQSIFKGQRFIKHEKDNSRKARMLLRLEELDLALRFCRFNADEIIKQ